MTSLYRAGGKRAFDLVGATLLLIITAPVQIAAACAVWATMGRPALFRQERPGRDGRTFRLRKFRTMQDSEFPDAGDEQRITRTGAFLRATSIDELPELWNVVVGQMSLVGPRPLLVEYLPLYSSEQHRRHELRPGLTGWAQINGRNRTSWSERFAMDVWYVDNFTFRLDLAILWRTLGAALRREGISAPGHATMPPFRGMPPTA